MLGTSNTLLKSLIWYVARACPGDPDVGTVSSNHVQPWNGTGVGVAVLVGVFVSVSVGVMVGVFVGVFVGVLVGSASLVSSSQ